MDRDPVLLAPILEAIEAAPYDFSNTPIGLHLEGYSEDAVAYHVLLLNEAGLITVSSHGVSEDGPPAAYPPNLGGSRVLGTDDRLMTVGAFCGRPERQRP